MTFIAPMIDNIYRLKTNIPTRGWIVPEVLTFRGIHQVMWTAVDRRLREIAAQPHNGFSATYT